MAFEGSKELLLSSKLLVYIVHVNLCTYTCTSTQAMRHAYDTSPYSIRLVLSHKMSVESQKPVRVVSRTLTKAENYSELDNEALACVGVNRSS